MLRSERVAQNRSLGFDLGGLDALTAVVCVGVGMAGSLLSVS